MNSIEASINNYQILKFIILVLVFLLIALLVYHWLYNYEDVDQDQSFPTIEETAWENIYSFTSSGFENSGVNITNKDFSWPGGDYQLIHRCQGEVVSTPENNRKDLFSEVPRYCVGRNLLLFQDANSDLGLVKVDNVIDPYKAPFLINAELFSDNYQALLVVSYRPVSCMTQDPHDSGCGVGLDNNYETLAIDVVNNNFKYLNNLPTLGELIWSDDGYKAVSIPGTCGGAGCTAEPLRGYDLRYDLVYILTEEKATETFDESIVVPGPENYFSSISGEELPYWSNVRWIDNNTATADINNPDNSVETIKMGF